MLYFLGSTDQTSIYYICITTGLNYFLSLFDQSLRSLTGLSFRTFTQGFENFLQPLYLFFCSVSPSIPGR